MINFVNLLTTKLVAATQLNPDAINSLPRVEATQDTLLSAMNTVYLWAGIVAVIVIIIAGFFYVISNGDAQKIQRAKNAILYSVVGLVVIIFAFTITQFVIRVVVG